MITVEQAKVLKTVLQRFVANEEKAWTDFDDHMEMLAWLDDGQLVVEAQVKLEFHTQNNARCTAKHSQDKCFVPVILDSMAYILDDYDENKRLVKVTRYMLQYYLAMSQTGVIITD